MRESVEGQKALWMKGSRFYQFAFVLIPLSLALSWKLEIHQPFTIVSTAVLAAGGLWNVVQTWKGPRKDAGGVSEPDK